MLKKPIRSAKVPTDPKRSKDRQGPNGEILPEKAMVERIVDEAKKPSSGQAAKPGRVPRGSRRPEERGAQQGQGGRPAG
jgi:hypothetical protein